MLVPVLLIVSITGMPVVVHIQQLFFKIPVVSMKLLFRPSIVSS